MSTHDELGFPIDQEHSSVNPKVLAKRRRKIHKLLPNYETVEFRCPLRLDAQPPSSENFERGISDMKSLRRKTIKKICRQGLPNEYRSLFWIYCLGSHHHSFKGEYDRLLSLELNESISNQIKMDILRTFPTNIYFKTYPDVHHKLSNVLHAFAQKIQYIGYCQGLSFVAGALLLFLTEEWSFWSLVAISEGLATASEGNSPKPLCFPWPRPSHKPYQIGVGGYYTHGMQLLLVDTQVMRKLFQHYCPKASDRMNAFNVEMSWICTEWLVSLFVIALPMNTVLRVWDSLFSEGWKIMFRVGVALLKPLAHDLSQAVDLEQFIQICKKSGKKCMDDNELMNYAFRHLGNLRRGELEVWRKEAADKVRQGGSSLSMPPAYA